MDLLQSFKQFIHQESLFSVNDRLILAVSGGVDSVVLCELCRLAGFPFAIAHVNFKLRGDESDADEAFVRTLSVQYGVDFYTVSFDTRAMAAVKKQGIQEAARELRYSWFSEISGICGQKYGQPVLLLTAHHANDQVETLLMNFFKGTGLNGLQGIAANTSFDYPTGKLEVRRPLLFAAKDDILSFAQEKGLTYREDSSNLSDDYTRNFFRHQLIPAIRGVFPEVEQNLLDNIARFRDSYILFRQSAEEHKKKLLEKSGESMRIAVRKLRKTAALRTVLYEILKEFHCTPGQTDEVIKLLDRESGKYISTRTHRIFRNRDWLLITSLKSDQASDILITNDADTIVYPSGRLTLSTGKGVQPVEPNPFVAVLDADQIEYPLLLRKWKQGDYFYPLGMQKKKKLSRFFIDRKLSVPEKENTWVIESARKIIWVVGLRIDDRCKVTPKTRQTISLVWEPASPTP